MDSNAAAYLRVVIGEIDVIRVVQGQERQRLAVVIGRLERHISEITPGAVFQANQTSIRCVRQQQVAVAQNGDVPQLHRTMLRRVADGSQGGTGTCRESIDKSRRVARHKQRAIRSERKARDLR